MRVGPTSAPSTPVRPPAPPAASRARGTKPFTAVLDEGAALAPRQAAAAPRPAGTSGAAPAPAPSKAAGPLRAMLERAVAGERQVDALLDAAARGKTFTPGELLAMQATVARYSQTVEVVSRAADRLVGAVKQTMGTQV
ncbi:MAG TPA: hypothetical protein VHO06_07835 [Polyangia bacterium]|nr:hypothetical protein [Polyangia bacterium]